MNVSPKSSLCIVTALVKDWKGLTPSPGGGGESYRKLLLSKALKNIEIGILEKERAMGPTYLPNMLCHWDITLEALLTELKVFPVEKIISLKAVLS